MSKTALIMSRDEALALPPEKRPLCYRVPSKIYHDVFEAVGAASLCWHPKPSTEVFDTNEASNVAVNLCFKIAAELERMGVTYEQHGENLTAVLTAAEPKSAEKMVPEAGIEPATKGL